MKNTIFYIDIATNRLVAGETGGVLMRRPSIIYGSSPYIEFHFVQEGNVVDLSDAAAFQVSIDTDFDLTTDPMARSIGDDIDLSQLESGIVIAHINTNTQKFYSTVNGKDSIGAQLEVRGFDSNGDTIYCVRVAIDCLGAVDLQALSTIPIPDNIASKSFVYGITSGFSRDVDDLQTKFESVEELVGVLSTAMDDMLNFPADLADSIDALSAAIDNLTQQGMEDLADKIDAISATVSGISSGSSFDGDYNSLTNKPDHSIYITSSYVENALALRPIENLVSSIAPGHTYSGSMNSDLTLSLSGGVSGKAGETEIYLDYTSGTLSGGTGLTIVTQPTAGKMNLCIVKWNGTSARLYVVDAY